MRPHVSIIILNWNSLQDTILCLESIFKMNYRNFDVLVIDNGSEENPELYLRDKYPQIRFIRNETNIGYTGGNNQGIKFLLSEAPEYFWLINNDVIVDKCCLTNLINEVSTDPKIGLASPLIYNNANDIKLQHCGNYLDLNRNKQFRFKDIEEFKYYEEREPESIVLFGTALLISRLLIEDIGYLDEHFFAYSEDFDYSVRSTKAGYKNVVIETAKVFHERRAKEHEDFPYHYYYYMARNKIIFWDKYRNLHPQKFLNTIRNACEFCINGDDFAADATLDGLYSAIRKYYGDCQNRKKAPAIVKKALFAFPRFILMVATSSRRILDYLQRKSVS